MSDRTSHVIGLGVLPVVGESEKAPRESENAVHQWRLLEEMIGKGLKESQKESYRLRPSDLAALNKAAVDGLEPQPGSYRLQPIEIRHSNHHPPPPEKVARYVEDMCEYITDRWSLAPVHLAAYVLWRTNWIHPYSDGNGRTARAAAYLVLCVRYGFLFPGDRTVMRMVAGDKKPYYAVLEKADAAALKDRLDISAMEDYLVPFCEEQLNSHLVGRGTGPKSGAQEAQPAFDVRESSFAIGPASAGSSTVTIRESKVGKGIWVAGAAVVLAAMIGGAATLHSGSCNPTAADRPVSNDKPVAADKPDAAKPVAAGLPSND